MSSFFSTSLPIYAQWYKPLQIRVEKAIDQLQIQETIHGVVDET
jgi:hypothetical protein